MKFHLFWPLRKNPRDARDYAVLAYRESLQQDTDPKGT